MDMAKRMTQDALLHCVCEGMDAQAHAHTKQVKEVQEGLWAEHLRPVARLQSARHRLFVRANGSAEMQLFDASFPPLAFEDRVFQACEDGLCPHIHSIDHAGMLA